MHVTLQVKRFVADYGPAIALALAILAAILLVVAGVTYATPPAETTTVETNKQEVSSSVSTSALVTENTTLYEHGTRLHDMPVYLFSVSPTLTFHVQTTAPADHPVSVTHRLVLHLTAVRDGEQFWSERRLLLADQTTTTDGTAWTNGTTNVTELGGFIADRRNEIGSVGQFAATIRLNTTYKTDRYTGTIDATTPIVTTSRAYWLGGPLTDSKTHSTAETRRIVGEPDLPRVAGFAGVALVLLSLAGWTRTRYRDLDPRELALELTRTRYDDWISTGEIPTKSEKEYIRVDTLADLVDIAIDSNKRVIHDTEFDVYGVVEGDIVYHFSIGDDDLTEWFDV